jgi:lipopolysaccharide export system permease protein
MIGKIWQRYILREFSKIFFLFLIGFYLLYVLIDYSTHAQDFIQGQTLFVWKILFYYLLQFVKRADVLLPLALLIATIKTLCQFNAQRELIALQVAGIRIKRLLAPLFYVAALSTLAVFLLNEFALPHALNTIDKFYDAHLRHSFRGKREQPLHILYLPDHSKLVYQYYDTAKEAFYDVIWLKNNDELWKMRYLKADPELPQGQWVDHFVRDSEGCFEKTQSFSNLSFRDLHWNQNIPRKGYIPYENRSISDLWKTVHEDPLITSYQRQEIFTQLLFKLCIPFVSVLVVLAIAPYCVNYSRILYRSMIYGCAIFGFAAFIALTDAMVILGESATLSASIAIFSPFILFFGIFGWKFARIR